MVVEDQLKQPNRLQAPFQPLFFAVEKFFDVLIDYILAEEAADARQQLGELALEFERSFHSAFEHPLQLEELALGVGCSQVLDC